jgi:hypothetical protein
VGENDIEFGRTNPPLLEDQEDLLDLVGPACIRELQHIGAIFIVGVEAIVIPNIFAPAVPRNLPTTIAAE